MQLKLERYVSWMRWKKPTKWGGTFDAAVNILKLSVVVFLIAGFFWGCRCDNVCFYILLDFMSRLLYNINNSKLWKGV